MTLTEAVKQFLDHHYVISLATHGEAGPWSSAVFYLHVNGMIYFLSAPHTRHCENLALDARAAGTVQGEESNWRYIKGVQLEGRVASVPSDCVAAVRERYLARFALDQADADPAVVRALGKVSWYALTPSRVYFIDNEKGLGHRDQVVWETAHLSANSTD